MKPFSMNQAPEELRTQLKEFLTSLNIRGYSIGAHTAIVFFYSPVSECIEERHMWASDGNECIAWLRQCKDTYSSLYFNYVTYLDGELDVSNGFTLDFKESPIELYK